MLIINIVHQFYAGNQVIVEFKNDLKFNVVNTVFVYMYVNFVIKFSYSVDVFCTT